MAGRAASAHRGLDDPWHEALALACLADATPGEESQGHRERALELLSRYPDERAAALRRTLGEGGLR
ncbi:hypothetical protein ACFVUW_03170 [Streptomyces xiamenensis]|uniref:hypothetical protein n=1 Tax=Streptomyces xiamenensis TaxID=408015 RepID=UPI0036EDC112